MGTVTVREVLRQVSALLLDADPQFERYAQVDAVDAVNEAQRVIFTYLPTACSRIDTWRLQAGSVHRIDSIAAADLRPGDGSTPTEPLVCSMLLDIFNNMGTDGVTVGRVIRPLTDGREAIDTLDPLWHSQADATHVLNFLYDPRVPLQFMTYPPVPAGRLWVRGSLVSSPRRIPNVGEAGYATYATSGSNPLTLGVPDDCSVDVVNYVAARLLMKNAEFSAATGMTPEKYAALFMGSINAKSQALLGYNPNLKALPLSPEPIGAAS